MRVAETSLLEDRDGQDAACGIKVAILPLSVSQFRNESSGDKGKIV